ncbi:hypothetical protein [Gimesia aquarii]|uniref:Uncharacterized protein n=1 Tax=Gimesia aquarii TaxID=2527964 RepID=A0A517X305_9PLAN|nr:hypothetical protein [Gimesia aquarii]QDU11872.1 hypothetical protein V202x_52970 [Gimesia aquarii]
MWGLVFMLLGLYSHWWKVCWLNFGNRYKWGEVGKFMICAVLSESWSIRDRLWPHFVTGKVKLGTKSSEDWEAVFALPMEILLKPVGFILLRSAGENQFSIEKNGFRAKMRVMHGVPGGRCGRQLWNRHKRNRHVSNSKPLHSREALICTSAAV